MNRFCENVLSSPPNNELWHLIPENSTRNKALWGYLLLIAVLLSSSWFVYHEINLLVSIKAVEADMRLKRQEMSSALSALYRAETVGQSLVWGTVFGLSGI